MARAIGTHIVYGITILSRDALQHQKVSEFHLHVGAAVGGRYKVQKVSYTCICTQ